MTADVRTCSLAVLHPGRCCADACDFVATVAVLAADMVEHARCLLHTDMPGTRATKPLKWDPTWGPEPNRQVWERRVAGTDVTELRLHLEVDEQGRARVHEAVLVQLLDAAGWERTA